MAVTTRFTVGDVRGILRSEHLSSIVPVAAIHRVRIAKPMLGSAVRYDHVECANHGAQVLFNSAAEDWLPLPGCRSGDKDGF